MKWNSNPNSFPFREVFKMSLGFCICCNISIHISSMVIQHSHDWIELSFLLIWRSHHVSHTAYHKLVQTQAMVVCGSCRGRSRYMLHSPYPSSHVLMFTSWTDNNRGTVEIGYGFAGEFYGNAPDCTTPDCFKMLRMNNLGIRMVGICLELRGAI